MKNSNSFSIISTKSLHNDDIHQKIKFKKSLKNYHEFNPISTINFPKNNSAINLLDKSKPSTTVNKNSNSINLKSIFNKINPACLQKDKKKYRNIYIFRKREFLFNKSMQEGRKVFKYNQSIDLVKNSFKNRKSMMDINSLYLTESLTKTTKNQTFSLPLLEKDKSLNDEYQTSIMNNTKNISFSRNSFINVNSKITNNKTNLINDEKNKKEDIILLKKINLNGDGEEKTLMKNISLKKKQKILEQNIKKNKTINNYMNDLKEFVLDKYNLNIKKEKEKVVNENLTNKLNKLNNDTKELESNSKLFTEEFYPKLNAYYKFYHKQKDIEKQKNLSYINKIYILQKHILIIKNRIAKRQREKQFLMREIFLQISIQEKKLTLPEYYKDILLNEFSFKQIKEKYGSEIDEEEYDRVAKYIDSLDISDMEIVLEKLNRLTNSNIELLNVYNKLCMKNLEYKKYKEKVEFEIKNDAQREIDNLIIEKEHILDNIIKKYKNTEKKYFNLLKNKSKNILGKKRSKLYMKLDNILKMLNDNLNYKINIDDKIKGDITEETLMIIIFKKIEMIIIRFLSEYKERKNNNPEKVKYFKNIFDKEKKIRKTLEQKRNIVLKFELERQKIFERYNKILFLPNRKIHYKKPNKKISFHEDDEKYEEKGRKIEDFLYG